MARSAPAPAESCVAAGPLGCDAPPASGTGDALCAQIRRCEIGRAPAFRGERIDTIARCSDVAQRLALPSDFGASALAVVRVEGETSPDDERSDAGEAAYLVTERDGRWCTAARLLPFDTHPTGTLADDFSLSLDEVSGHVYVNAHRIAHGSLDADEAAAGVSDVEYEGCDNHVFALDRAGGLSLVRSKWTTPGSCDAASVQRDAAKALTPPGFQRDALVRPPAGACQGSGPLACDLGNKPEAEDLCARLSECLERQRAPWLLSSVESCAGPLESIKLAGGVTAGILHARGKVGALKAEAAYLVAVRPNGHQCLIDQVFDAASEYVLKPAPVFQLAWSEPNQRLNVRSEHGYRRRTARGESEDLWERELVSFRVQSGAFTLVEQQTRREPGVTRR